MLNKSRLRSALLPDGERWRDADLPQAAVLVLLCPAPHWHTLLTVRSDTMRLHAGQISFPGGRRETADPTPERTALRETFEETGLPTTSVEILGRLDDTSAGSGIVVTPVVGWCDALPTLTPNPREVASLLHLPLDLALDVEAYGEATQALGGAPRSYVYLDHGGHHVWGATARILHGLARRVMQLRQS